MDTLNAFEGKEKQCVASVGNKYASFRVIAIYGVEQK
jgi:hypothetical protein